MDENLEKLRILQNLAAGHAFVTAGAIKRWCDYNANHEDARYCTQQILEQLIALEQCIVAVRAVSHDIIRATDEDDDDHR